MLSNHIYMEVSTKFAYFSIAVNEFPVLKADGIKYIMIFRNQVSFSFTLVVKTYCSLLFYTCQAQFILLDCMLTHRCSVVIYNTSC